MRVYRRHGPRHKTANPMVSGLAWKILFLATGLAVALPRTTVRAEQDERQQLAEAIKVKSGATCLDGPVLTEQVRKWLGRNDLDRRIRVYVEGSQTSPTRASFTVAKGDGYVTSRRFVSAPENCSAFHSALALSIALAIQSTYLEPESEAPVYSGALRRVAVVWQQFVDTGIVTDLSLHTFAPLGFGPRLELGWFEWLDARMGIIATYALPQRVRADTGATFGAQLWSARGDLCGGGDVGPGLRIRGCGGLMYGQFRTEGLEGLSERDIRADHWGAMAIGTDLTGDLSGTFAIGTGLDFVFPWWERVVQIRDQDGSIFAERELPAVGVTFGINLVFRVRPIHR